MVFQMCYPAGDKAMVIQRMSAKTFKTSLSSQLLSLPSVLPNTLKAVVVGLPLDRTGTRFLCRKRLEQETDAQRRRIPAPRAGVALEIPMGLSTFFAHCPIRAVALRIVSKPCAGIAPTFCG